ncbi:low-density lipoprotein receptor class A domain-containing protein 4-like isoform X1 [Neodiprion fabricii]|uniref:low-density lipoprotein receptor class A domain-containing protein 4-like isoform X1 n=1 Tax=Neodiprion fabricii TaxID=2872261 RepID=UPI001ED91669|nr:low-density lipoprotein receptor class A domain-containing protein 4-like isoform X1 [Neodiprion fabricii]XP_046423366.1 low-density lipoprotein receptor class A domain-containing protein 4-like isoform X1 [Neodiprion fabricii]XP_046423368.1 low-density lipoprotein receptor class A domain-containing protein 4-like isoform X1 [Neodiprion fabricii]
MSPRSNSEEPSGTEGDDEIVYQRGSPRRKEENENEDEDIALTQPPPSPTNHSSMESLSRSGYILSVVLVLAVGGIVGVLATVSHHFHRRHQRRLPEAPGASDALSTTDDRQLRHSATPMLSVSGGMEVGSGGRGGRGGLGGSLQEDGPTSRVENDVVAATKDRAVRASSVRQDLALDLPPRLQLPDGEERPYGAHAGLHLRDPEQESEIYQKCVRPPPNRTVFDSESPPAYRSQAALLDAPDRIVRCHSAGSSLLKVFRKFPNSGSSTPSVIVPRRPTLSSYSESSSNLSNLSSLTVVPCETDETHQHV